MSRELKNWKDAYLTLVDDTEPPILYKEWVAISVIASALERKCYSQFGNLKFYPNMYIVLVGPSGRCRKSVAMGSGRDFLDTIDIKRSPDATTRVGLIGELEDAATNAYNMPDGKVVESHCSLTVYSPELTVFLGYGQSELLTDLTNWYDCDPNWKYKTQGRGLQAIQNVWVNLFGATTPDLISSALPRDTVGGGMASRIVFVYATQKGKSIALTDMPEMDETLHNQLKHDLQEINNLSGRFQIAPNFAEVFEGWYKVIDANRPTDDPRFAGYTERRATHIIKLCMILSAARSSDMIIDAEVFNQALDLLVRTEVKMFNTFRGSGMANEAETTKNVMDVINDRRAIGYSELLYMFHHDALKYTMDKILETLVEMDYCKRQADSESGKVVYVALMKKS